MAESTVTGTTTERPTPGGVGKGLVVLVAVVMLLVGLGGGYYLYKVANPAPPAPSPGAVSGLPVASSIPEVMGWYANTSITYLNFGTNSNITAPILAFVGPGGAVVGQHNIIDTIPGQPGYSAFWRLYTVGVPSGYVADSIRSLQEALARGYAVTETATVINCPVVNPGTVLQGQSGPLVQGWYRDQTVFYWAGETNSAAYGDVVGTAPLYALQYANGTPVPNQRHIVGVIPGKPGYSDLWQIFTVTVGASYVANTYESVYALFAAQKQGTLTIAPTSTLVNCPIVS